MKPTNKIHYRGVYYAKKNNEICFTTWSKTTNKNILLRCILTKEKY